MPLGFIGFPYVADFATLVVNAGLLILQPLARLCVGCHMLRMTSHLVSQFPFLRHLRNLREEEEFLAEIAEPAEEIIKSE